MKKLLSVSLAVLMILSMIPLGVITASAFSKDNFKAEIKEIHIGAPITGLDGKRYYPVDVHFTSNEDLSNSEMVHFLEGHIKAILKNGTTAESVKGLGMTLMGPLKPDVPLENSNMWTWNWKGTGEDGGEGVIKYNVPILEDGEEQTVEKSQATGLTEVNGVKEGDKLAFQNETVVNTTQFPQNFVEEVFPDGSSVFSLERVLEIEPEKYYPKIVAFDTVDEDETTAPASEEVETTAPASTDVEPTTEALETTASEPTTAPEVTTSPEGTDVPEVTTEPAPTGTTSNEAVLDDPTEPPTQVTGSTDAPTTPDDKPTQPETEATTSGEVVTPTEPSTGGAVVVDPTGVAPTNPETVKPENDKSSTPKVTKKANTMKVKLKAKTFKAKSKKKTVIKAKKVFKIRKAKGKVTYKKAEGNKKIKISKKGKITVKKGLKKGKVYKVKVQIIAKGNDKYSKKKVIKTIKIKVK